jgi:hypothetical protein
MARIKYASIVSSVSGSIGSATFQKSLYGDTLRNKPRPRLSSSSLQLNRRYLMTQIHNAWRDLDNAQRLQWNQFIGFSSAVIARDKHILQTGHSLFIQYNYLRLLTGLAILTDITYTPLSQWPPIVSIENAAGTLEINFDGPNLGSTMWFVLKMSAPRLSSLSFNPKGCRYCSTTFADDSVFWFTGSYQSLFGTIPANGQTIHYIIRFFQLTAPILSGKVSGTWVLAPMA